MTARYKIKNQIIRPLANAATQTAQTALLNTYAALGQTGNTPTPVVEGDLNSFNHDYGEDGVRTYWYHPDHLGSSSYITNVEGIVTQHMEYIPYGESLVEEHQNSINTPYKFNGKEQDDETGNYYYGARYYNPKFSFWLSVDPLAEKYYSISSYAYCAGNPIANKEVDGRYFIFVPGLGYSEKSGYANSEYVGAYGQMIDSYDRDRGGLGGATVNGSRGGRNMTMNRLHDGLYVLWWGSKVRGNVRNDHRAMNIINHTSANYGKVREAGDNFDMIGTSQGTVSTAQAVVGMLEDPESFGLPSDFKIDNLYLAGAMVDPKSKLGKQLQSYAESGQIGNLQYISAEGDTIEGLAGEGRGQAFSNLSDFFKMLKTPDHPHLRAAENKPNNPNSGCSSSACEVRQVITKTYQE